MEFIKDVAKLMTTSGFNNAFPKSRLCTEVDVHSFFNETGEDDEYIPFFLSDDGGFDYYCYEKNPTGAQPRISVYAVHTFVEDWDSPEAFLSWVEQIIKKYET